VSRSVAARSGGIEGYFQIKERGSSIRTEVIAGEADPVAVLDVR
jgi:xanthine/uracil/vitamin C permease (AzgA family)